MNGVVAGRDAELEALREFVARIPSGAVGLVLEGEAGVGKTTLWRAAVEHADERGIRVLQAQPVESETTLSFVGVGDLLEPVLDAVLEPLPAVQRRALERALVLGEEEEPPLDPRALRVALMNALRILAEERPLLMAIDDSQWLDYASAAGLAYGVRRFRTESIGVLLSRRSGLESVILEELLRSPAGERFTRLHVGALDMTSLGRVVQRHLGATLPRPLLAEVYEAAGGNPFYALEIVRMLRRSEAPIEAGHPLPVPDSLHDLVHGRLLALPEESREFLLAAAAQAHPTVAVTENASGIARAQGLEPALEAHVVELDGQRIRFTHPLLAAGVYESGSALRRLEIHRRLAELLEDPEARAWQLAASADEPDESIAAELERASQHARSRGAPRPAALLLDRARELTPADRPDDGYRRAIDAAYLHYESGDSPRAEAQLEAVIAEVSPGSMRARALVRLARVRSYEQQREAAALFLQAIDEAEGHPEIVAVAHEGVSACLFRLRERLDEAVDHAETARRLAVQLGDDGLAAEALGSRLLPETLLGRASAEETAAQALALQDAASERRVLGQPIWVVAVNWWWTDQLDRARDANLEMLRRCAVLGDESSVPYVLVLLGFVECKLGLYGSALQRALEGRELAEQSGQRTLVAYHRALEGLIQAYRGRIEPARSAAVQGLELASMTDGRPAWIFASTALGHLELALGNARAAVDPLTEVVAFAREQHFAEPAAMPFVIDLVEALIEAGRSDDARDLLAWHEANAIRLERASALASCARCRGLLASASGDVAGALACYDDALEWHARVDLPLDRARTLLALGAAQRRAKRRREARVTLEEALAAFGRLGAALWAERAEAELRRISGRAPVAGALTPAEGRVAALVAEGKTNREVAAALYLSDRTVEGHLSRVFGKLGIRHRNELRQALEARQTQGEESSNTGDPPISAQSLGS